MNVTYQQTQASATSATSFSSAVKTIEPAKSFDDIDLCNSVGVYKNGSSNSDGLFDAENIYLNNLTPPKSKFNVLVKDFALYPNPASTQITIDYQLQNKQKGNLIIYDLLGRERINIDLNPNINRTTLNISFLEQGLFAYKYLVNNISTVTGKLLIE